MSKTPNVPFRVLHANFPSTATVKPEQLYASIGHSEKLAIPGWENTCAVRMSVALLLEIGGNLVLAPEIAEEGEKAKGSQAGACNPLLATQFLGGRSS